MDIILEIIVKFELIKVQRHQTSWKLQIEGQWSTRIPQP